MREMAWRRLLSQDDSRKSRSARVRHQMRMCRDAIFDATADYPAAGALRVVMTRYAMALPWTKNFASDYGAWLPRGLMSSGASAHPPC